MTALATTRWVRSTDGWFAGVCQGMARHFSVEPWIVRGLWLVSIFWFGTGLFLYICLAICLPREDKIDEAMNKKLLGVCRKIAFKYDFEVGIVRLLFVLLAFSSFGLAIFFYLVMGLVMPKEI
jgi:phage shock protein PspC (stress-responsive transcriptional regulator)